jgi:hypothetical protein
MEIVMRSEIEDGMGFAGLVPTAAERREGSEVKRLGDRIVALTKERDDYILKQKVWEAANDEFRSEHIRFQRANEYALRLVLSLAARFPAVEGFHSFPDLYGRLTQIDNMTASLPVGFGNSGEGK